MSGYHAGKARRQFTFDHVQVGPADAAGVDLDEDFVVCRFRCGQISIGEGIGFDCGGGFEKLSVHGFTLSR
jgi:hypothetical protein